MNLEPKEYRKSLIAFKYFKANLTEQKGNINELPRDSNRVFVLHCLT